MDPATADARSGGTTLHVCMTEIRIETLDDPRLDPFRSLRLPNRRRDPGVFIAEGPTMAERVFRSGLRLHSVLVSDRKYESVAAMLPSEVIVYRLTHTLAKELVGYSFHTGLLICGERPTAPRLSDCVCGQDPGLIVAGERISDPENVGALIRIAAAFGAALVVLGPGSADACSRRVLRVSMGYALLKPVLRTDDLPSTLQQLRDAWGYHVEAAALTGSAVPASDVRFSPRTVLVFGNEFEGLSGDVLRIADRCVAIPMRDGTDSLNVAVAAGIFSWVFRTQHPASPAAAAGRP